MIFFSSDKDFAKFYNKFKTSSLSVDILVTESPKKQGRSLSTRPNPAHQFALDNSLEILSFDRLDEQAIETIKQKMPEDKLGFIFAYGKLIPSAIINLFENGILNIHFSLLPEYPGASPIQQAILDGKQQTGYTVFEITEKLDNGPILIQEEIKILQDDNFDSLRSRIINKALDKLPEMLQKYLKWEITLRDMTQEKHSLTRKISKQAGEITGYDSTESAYRKVRAYSHWPKTYIMIDDKRLIILGAKLSNDKLEITEIQPEGKKPMSFKEFANGYRHLLTKLPLFVKID